VGVWVAVYTGVFSGYISMLPDAGAPKGSAQNPISVTPPNGYIASSTAPTPDTTGLVQVTAIAPNEITVKLSNGQSRSFVISSNTPIYTTVLNNGQTGKALSDISVGTMINVYWHENDPNTASSLAFGTNAVLGLTDADNSHVLAGTVTGLTDKEVIIVPPTASLQQPLTITLTPATEIATIVTTDHKGKSLLIGQLVVARGLVTTGTTTTAKAIVIAAGQ